MKLNPLGLRAVLLTAALGIPAHAAFAQQYTGVSRPEQVPISVSPEGVAQPVVYTPAATDQPGAPYATPSSEPAPAALPYSAPTGTSAAPSASQIAEARTEPAPLHPDPLHDDDSGIVTHVPGPANGLPQGTLLKARMLVDLSTEHTTLGTPWTAELTAPLERDGRVLIPAGSLLSGKVTEVHGGRRISGTASIHLQTLSVTLPDGTTLGLHAMLVDTDLTRRLRVDDEGTLAHRDHRKEEAAVLALTAGSGAAAGGVLAGLPGALVGAGIGAGISTVIWLREDRQAELPKDTEVVFELSRPLPITQ